jgi:hypothetical protein
MRGAPRSIAFWWSAARESRASLRRGRREAPLAHPPPMASTVKCSGQRSKSTRDGESSNALCGGAFAPTHDPSPRQLPTDHDHVGAPLGRSTDIRLINRRNSCFDRCPVHLTGPPPKAAFSTQREERLDGSFHIRAPIGLAPIAGNALSCCGRAARQNRPQRTVKYACGGFGWASRPRNGHRVPGSVRQPVRCSRSVSGKRERPSTFT